MHLGQSSFRLSYPLREMDQLAPERNQDQETPPTLWEFPSSPFPLGDPPDIHTPTKANTSFGFG